MSDLKQKNTLLTQPGNSDYSRLYKIGGVCAILSIVLVVFEMSLTALPDGAAEPVTVLDWFSLFERNWFMGMRNLGLVNIFMMAVLLPLYFSLFIAHYSVNKVFSSLSFILFLIGISIYFANNTSFAMLTLSEQYAAATTDVQKSAIVGAGEAMLALGESHTMGTYVGFFIGGLAGILINIVIYKSKVFGKMVGIAGLAGSGLLLTFDSVVSFAPSLFMPMMVFAIIGGLSTMAWYVLLAIGFFKLAKQRGA